MRKTITLKWLKKRSACYDFIVEFENKGIKETRIILDKLIDFNFGWFIWLIIELFPNNINSLKLLLYVFELALKTCVKRDQNLVRYETFSCFINSTKAYIKKSSKKNREILLQACEFLEDKRYHYCFSNNTKYNFYYDELLKSSIFFRDVIYGEYDFINISECAFSACRTSIFQNSIMRLKMIKYSYFLLGILNKKDMYYKDFLYR